MLVKRDGLALLAHVPRLANDAWQSWEMLGKEEKKKEESLHHLRGQVHQGNVP